MLALLTHQAMLLVGPLPPEADNANGSDQP